MKTTGLGMSVAVVAPILYGGNGDGVSGREGAECGRFQGGKT